MKNSNDYEYNEILAELYNAEQSLLSTSFQSKEHTFSELFSYRIKRLVHNSVMESRILHIRNNTIAIIGVFLLVLAICRPQSYVYAYKNVFEWFSDHYKVIFSDSSSMEKVPNFNFEYIPYGYSLVDSSISRNLSYYLYENANHETISIIVTLSDATINIDNENNNYHEYVDSKGQRIYYLESNDNLSPSIIIWNDNGLAYEIDGMISKDELEKIKNNIKKREN